MRKEAIGSLGRCQEQLNILDQDSKNFPAQTKWKTTVHVVVPLYIPIDGYTVEIHLEAIMLKSTR